MSRKRYTPEQIIGMLCEVEVELSRGQKLGHLCRNLGITEQTYYRWRRDYGGKKVNQEKRMKELEKENGRLKRALAGLRLDKLILKEALRADIIRLAGEYGRYGYRRITVLLKWWGWQMNHKRVERGWR